MLISNQVNDYNVIDRKYDTKSSIQGSSTKKNIFDVKNPDKNKNGYVDAADFNDKEFAKLVEKEGYFNHSWGDVLANIAKLRDTFAPPKPVDDKSGDFGKLIKDSSYLLRLLFAYDNPGEELLESKETNEYNKASEKMRDYAAKLIGEPEYSGQKREIVSGGKTYIVSAAVSNGKLQWIFANNRDFTEAEEREIQSHQGQQRTYFEDLNNDGLIDDNEFYNDNVKEYAISKGFIGKSVDNVSNMIDSFKNRNNVNDDGVLYRLEKEVYKKENADKQDELYGQMKDYINKILGTPDKENEQKVLTSGRKTYVFVATKTEDGTLSWQQFF